MKLIEKEIEFQRKEKIELNKLIEPIEVNIQNNFNDIIIWKQPLFNKKLVNNLL